MDRARFFTIIFLSLCMLPGVLAAVPLQAQEAGYHNTLWTTEIRSSDSGTSTLVLEQGTIEFDNSAATLRTDGSNNIILQSTQGITLQNNDGVTIPNSLTLSGYQINGVDNSEAALLGTGNPNTLSTQRAVQRALSQLNSNLNNSIAQVNASDIEGSGTTNTIPIFTATQEIGDSSLSETGTEVVITKDVNTARIIDADDNAYVVDPSGASTLNTASLNGLTMGITVNEFDNDGTDLLNDPESTELPTEVSVESAIRDVESTINNDITNLNTTINNVDASDIEGSGTVNYLPKFVASQQVGDSSIRDTASQLVAEKDVSIGVNTLTAVDTTGTPYRTDLDPSGLTLDYDSGALQTDLEAGTIYVRGPGSLEVRLGVGSAIAEAVVRTPYLDDLDDPGNYFVDPNSNSILSELEVEGDILLGGSVQTTGADVAEWLPAKQGVTPGDVVVVNRNGELQRTSSPGDTRVVGIVSTEPGVVLGEEKEGMVRVAMTGTAPARATPSVQPGDRLQTSSVPGAVEPCTESCAGRMVGKALQRINQTHVKAIVTLG